MPVRRMSPKILFAQIIDPRRIELYWDQEVENAAEASNFALSRWGRQLALVSDPEAEWNLLNVYEPSKKRTTLILKEPLSSSDLGAIGIRLSSRIESRSHHRTDPDRLVTIVNWSDRYTQFTKARCGVTIKSSSDVAYHVRALAAQITERPVEGYGGMPTDATTSISARNILRITEGVHQTRYPNESILAHEFGHAIHLLGINLLADKALARELDSAYEHAKDSGLWPKTYLMLNIEEYFATLTAMWFNVMAESDIGTWDGVRGPLNTRDELREYDPAGFSLLAEIYPVENLPRPWNENPVNRSYVGHMDDVPQADMS